MQKEDGILEFACWRQIRKNDDQILTLVCEENALLVQLLMALESLIDLTIVFPIHPRTKKMFGAYGLLDRLLKCSNVRLMSPVGYIDFIALLQNAMKAITDSGGIQKESYLLKVPCITIRNNTEWIETSRGRWNVMTGMDSNKIIEAVRSRHPTSQYDSSIFGNGNTSQVINDIITTLD
jgi:UDP-GlcNAc3NAcA epimerase